MTVDPSPANQLRTRQTDLTRRVIVTALADLVIEGGVQAVSVREIAERAGVSQRTIYNHFPDRQALLDGLAQVIDEEFSRFDIAEPDTLDDFRDVMPGAFRALASNERMVQAYVMLAIGARAQAGARQRRTERLAGILRRELPIDAGSGQVEAITGVMRLLFSATAFYQLTNDHGLAPDRAGRTIQWVLDLVIDELEAGRLPDLDTDRSPSGGIT